MPPAMHINAKCYTPERKGRKNERNNERTNVYCFERGVYLPFIVDPPLDEVFNITVL